LNSQAQKEENSPSNLNSTRFAQVYSSIIFFLPFTFEMNTFHTKETKLYGVNIGYLRSNDHFKANQTHETQCEFWPG